MNNLTNKPTIISCQSYDIKMTYELPYSDCSVEDYLNGFVACLVGLTFPEEAIYRGMKDYLEEHYDND